MLRPLICCTLFFISSLSHAQVNTEQYRSETEETHSTLVEFDLGLKKGNVDFLTAGLDVGSIWTGDESSVLFIVDGSFASKRTLSDYAESPNINLLDSEAQYINKILSHARYNRNLTERWVLELFSQVEKNDFLLMDRRLLAGVGPRFTLVDEENGGLALGVAYMLEHERLNGESIHPTDQDRDTLSHRATSYLSGTAMIAESSSLGGTLYFQPRLTDPSDFRALGEVEFSVSITEVFALTVEFIFRHDSLPPLVDEGEPEMKPTDLAIGQSLQIAF